MFTQIQAVRTGFKHRFIGATEAQGTEGLRKGELLRMTGPAIPLDKISGNGRHYIPESVHAQVADLQPRIAQKALFGVLDHPAVDDINKLAYVKMTDVSHRIDALWYNEADKTYYITVTILDTPNGRILKTIHDSGSPLYVSLRSLLDPSRTVQRNGYVDAYMLALITVDFVSRPGFADAEMKAVDVAGNESALAVCEALNLFAKTSKRIFDMKRNNKSRYIPVISMESIAGIATEPTKEFKTTVTGFIADVLDKLPGKFTPADFAEAYPDSLFNDCIVGLYEGSVELMIKDAASSTVAIISLCSDVDGEYELCDEHDVQYFNTEVVKNTTGADAANEGMYAIIATEGYEPSEDFIDTAKQVAAYMKDNYGDGFSQDDFNTDIAPELLDKFNVSARIDTTDDQQPELKFQNDTDAASIILSGDSASFVPGEIAEYWLPGTEAYEVGTVVTLKDAEGEDIVSGEIENSGTFGELKDTIESEDEIGFSNMTAADITDDVKVVKIAGNWYYVNDEVSMEYCATESIDAIQQTDGNQPAALNIDEDYMHNNDDTEAGKDVTVEVIDEEDDEAKNAKSGLASQMYTIVEDDNAAIIEDDKKEDDPKKEDNDDKKKDDKADSLEADAELAEEAQRIFAMPNSKFAGNYAIEHMPVAFKHIWSGLSDAAKATVAMQAQQACIANESQNLKFWHSTNFIAIERACLINKGEVQAALESMAEPEDPRVAFMKRCIKR